MLEAWASRAVRTQAFIDNVAMNTENHDARLIALLDRIAQQDHAALKSLYEQCASKLYGLALRVVTNRDWAEDVLQESFLTIWRSAGDYRASLSPPMAWLGLVVRSRGLDMLRRRAADRSHLTQELDDVLADTLEGEQMSPLDTAQASEQAWACTSAWCNWISANARLSVGPMCATSATVSWPPDSKYPWAP